MGERALRISITAFILFVAVVAVTSMMMGWVVNFGMYPPGLVVGVNANIYSRDHNIGVLNEEVAFDISFENNVNSGRTIGVVIDADEHVLYNETVLLEALSAGNLTINKQLIFLGLWTVEIHHNEEIIGGYSFITVLNKAEADMRITQLDDIKFGKTLSIAALVISILGVVVSVVIRGRNNIRKEREETGKPPISRRAPVQLACPSAQPKIDGENKHLIEALLCQYGECWSDVRQYDNLIWQIPSMTTIIAGVLVALSSTMVLFIQIALFIVALSLNIVMTIALYKHQFFRIHRFREIQKIEAALEKHGIHLVAKGARSTVQIKDEIAKGNLKDMPQGWFYDRIAYNWIRKYMHLLTIVLVSGLIVTVIRLYIPSLIS